MAKRANKRKVETQGAATLKENIAAYEKMRETLEADKFGRWVIFHNRELAGDFGEVKDAILSADERFGRGPYLIRKVGEGPLCIRPSIVKMTPVVHDRD